MSSISTPKTYDDLLEGEPLRPVRNVATVMDVTEQVRAAEALRAEDVSPSRKAEKALREMNQRKDDFLATLAHELRNPLAPILTSLQLLPDFECLLSDPAVGGGIDGRVRKL